MQNKSVLKILALGYNTYLPRRSRRSLFSILNSFFVLSVPFVVNIFLPLSFTDLYAQDTTELIKLITPDSEEKKKTEADTNKELSITETQKKLIRKVLDILSDREVDEYLRAMGLSTEGSIYAKRQRLRDSVVSKDEKIKEELSLQQQEANKKQDSFVIENASEGELLSVDKTKSGVLILRGKVKLKIGQGHLIADSISVDSKKNEIYAEGNVEFLDKSLTVKGEKFIYDVKLERGVVYDTKATLYPSFFVGKKIKKIDENKYVLDMGHFTACGAEIPHYTFKAKRIVFYNDNSIIATNLKFQVGGTDLFWIPLYYSSNLGSGWTTQFGKNRSQGSFFQGSYQWSDPTAVPSLFMPVGRKVKVDFFQITGQAVAFDFWKTSPWLNYNLETGYANYKYNRFVDTYESRYGVPKDPIGNVSNVVTSNQVDKGDLCAYNHDPNSKLPCLATASDVLKSNNGWSNPVRNFGTLQQDWSKINLNANARNNNIAGDGTRNLQVRFENYSNPRYDFEFGYRYEPSNTLQSLYTRRQQRNPFIRQNTVWSLDYTQTHGDLTVNISARRNYSFLPIKPQEYEGFFPLYEELPRTSIRNSSQVGTIPYFFAPVYWDININNVVKRFYSTPSRNSQSIATGAIPNLPGGSYPYGDAKSAVARTEIETVVESGMKTNLNFGGYLTFSPSAYYGFQKYTLDIPGGVQQTDLSRERELRRNSYIYTRQNHRLSYGVPALLFSSTFRWTDGTRSELPEQTLLKGRDRVKELEFALESNAFENLEFSVKTIRDLREFAREYNPQPTNQQRWYFTVARAAVFFDFIDGFGKKKDTLLEKRRSFYTGIFINNDYVYHTAQHSPLYNNATLSYKMGGFSLPFIRNIKNFEVGGTWFHVFKNSQLEQFGVYAGQYNQAGRYNNTRSAFLDSYRFYIQTDLQVSRNFGLELELDSRVTQPWRFTDEIGQNAIFRNGTDQATIDNSYQQYTSPNTSFQQTTIQRDLANGLGLNGAQARQTTAFNVNRFIFVGKYNIHNFEYRLGYSMDLRAIPGGTSLDSLVTFYDQSVFFSINLLNVNLGPDEPAAAQSRARIYRFRKRPLDKGIGGYSGVTAEGP
ncbi:MAG: LPS-assembly protein LptD [Leptospiraceae bacterium]|nr:LPS-assembly protein LptD [Leptospiraceae bacterium]